MQLKTFLTDEKITYADFARRIGTPHARTVERYAKGQRHPRPRMMDAIKRETGGKVTANDFPALDAE